jgi:hypothetical protein
MLQSGNYGKERETEDMVISFPTAIPTWYINVVLLSKGMDFNNVHFGPSNLSSLKNQVQSSVI